MSGRAIVTGGSIGGLFAATMLRRAGWEVTVLERVDVELSGRGAGIVTHDLLNRMIEAAGATTADLGVDVAERVAFDLDGGVVARRDLPQVVTSWDRVHSLLRAQMPEAGYRLGVQVTGYDDRGDSVVVHTAGGERIEADLLVGADGFRSAVRGQLLPQVQPVYSGYVVWRALAAEADLSPAVREAVFPHFGMFMPTGTQIVGYPIAGPDNDLRPGRRRYNFVWYVPTPPEALDRMLTDATGARHALSIPPPLVRDAVVDEGIALAERLLPPPFQEILRKSERPFFTPIYDHLSPVMALGRVALAGDAACVARPHIGMGVTKAACDAGALVRNLAGAPVAQGLATYSAERQPAARQAMQIAQLLGGMIHQCPAGATNADGRHNPNLNTILLNTAVVPPPEGLIPAG